MAIIETKVLKTMSTGEKIKIHRQNRGMSQIDLAKIMGKSPVWLSKIEKEQREIRVSDLEKICKVLQVEVDQLLNVGIKNNSYKTILQNVVSSLPHEVPVYKMNEIKKILRSNETVMPTLYYPGAHIFFFQFGLLYELLQFQIPQMFQWFLYKI